jgi:ATP-dependent exoDNAse (exonuclease V) beta subunit/CRISPR/Cas system-associated exonuclease Cas4 (RecB family)
LSNLTIYKASAGSGKTYRIAGEYLKLLFENNDNYQHILGVTFTNKATSEMKSRIINELYKLSKGEKSGYTIEISEHCKIKPDEVKYRAAGILYKILHDYSHFTITTIDSFFQRIIRAFGREIGLLHGFELELEQDKVLKASIEQMLFNIDSHPELKQWLVNFAEDKIMDGKSWNIVADIESLGNELFKENYKEHAEKLREKITNKSFIKNYSTKLSDYLTKTEQKVNTLAQEAKKQIQGSGLSVDDFKGKSRSIAAFFVKLADKGADEEWSISDTNRNRLDNPEEWYQSKSNKQPEIENLYHSGLNRILGELISICDSDFIIYKSIVKVQKNLYVLGMINDLQANIREYTSDKNLFLISDSAQFLNKLIDGADAPFVYERTGTYIQHFMIDEFQDTSVLQWNNFRPLIINSLSEANRNWVVGDVKQSIYRWRNSDWTILSGKIADDIYPHPMHVETLNYNWRSCINIVRFNNTFFHNAIDQLSQLEHGKSGDSNTTFSNVLKGAYSNFEQLVPETKNNSQGYVRIESIKAEGKKNKDWQSLVLEKLPSFIMELRESGYSLADIAILVRDKKEAKLVADYFLNYKGTPETMHYRFDILSGDSLLLKNSEIVKWLISCYTYIISPYDKVNSTCMALQYLHFIKGIKDADVSKLFDTKGELLLDEALTGYFNQTALKQLSIYELTDELIIHFGLNEKSEEFPFLQAFQDLLHNYIKRDPADIHSFLTWWDENKDKKVISMPESQDSMRLMTIHSSKGLEFPVVIIPFGDWEIMKVVKNSNYLWCSPKNEPLNEMDLLPVNLSSALEETIFNEDYQREMALLYVDNLNLLYVAFTRAVNVLSMYIPDFSEEKVKNNVATLISGSILNQKLEIENCVFPAVYLPSQYNGESNLFEYGIIPPNEKATYQGSDLMLEKLEYPTRNISDVSKQVPLSWEYLQESDQKLRSCLKSGKVMHEIFQYLKTEKDINKALLKVFTEGKISSDDLEQITSFVCESVNDPLVRNWFEPDWELKNETSIILPDGSMHRPDRVMIKDKTAIVVDYKFGDEEKKSHLKQVANYMEYLEDMGYRDINGYVWYVSKKNVVPVNSKLSIFAPSK